MSSSNFRKIKPCYRDPYKESSASASRPSQSASESTEPDPRRPRVDKDIPAESGSSSPKRRRVPESVTRNACLNCKKARTKVSTLNSSFLLCGNQRLLCRTAVVVLQDPPADGCSVMARSRAKGVRHGSRPLSASTRFTSSMRRKSWSSESRSLEPRTI